MSETLSMISRQLEPVISSVVQLQSLQSSAPPASMVGTSTSGGGGLPSGSFQTKSIPFFSCVVHARVRARSGTRLAYGIPTQRPSGDQRQSWNGQAMLPSFTVPCVRSPLLCWLFVSCLCWLLFVVGFLFCLV